MSNTSHSPPVMLFRADGLNGEEPESHMLTEALAWAGKGYPVFPCHHSGSCAKQPLVSGGFKKATTDPKKIRAWWTKWPNALIGLPTGEPSGLTVLDIDAKNEVDGFAALPNWRKLSPVRSATPSSGAHLYFRSPKSPLKNSVGKIARGVDVRGDGGYVVVPPSRLDGKAYSWEAGSLDALKDLPGFPDDLLAKLNRKNRSERNRENTRQDQDSEPRAKIATYLLRKFCREIATANEGTRNDTLNRYAFIIGQWVGADALQHESARKQLFDAALQSGLEEDEVERTVTRALSDGMKNLDAPRLILDRNDHMLSARELIAVEFTDEKRRRTIQRYRGDFHIWDGRRYREASDEEVRSRVWNFLEHAFLRGEDEEL